MGGRPLCGPGGPGRASRGGTGTARPELPPHRRLPHRAPGARRPRGGAQPPGEVALHDVLPGWAPLSSRPPSVFVGGPVDGQDGPLPRRARTGHQGGRGPRRRRGERPGGAGRPRRRPRCARPGCGARVFAGYAGWDAGSWPGRSRAATGSSSPGCRTTCSRAQGLELWAGAAPPGCPARAAGHVPARRPPQLSVAHTPRRAAFALLPALRSRPPRVAFAACPAGATAATVRQHLSECSARYAAARSGSSGGSRWGSSRRIKRGDQAGGSRGRRGVSPRPWLTGGGRWVRPAHAPRTRLRSLDPCRRPLAERATDPGEPQHPGVATTSTVQVTVPSPPTTTAAPPSSATSRRLPAAPRPPGWRRERLVRRQGPSRAHARPRVATQPARAPRAQRRSAGRRRAAARSRGRGGRGWTRIQVMRWRPAGVAHPVAGPRLRRYADGMARELLLA